MRPTDRQSAAGHATKGMTASVVEMNVLGLAYFQIDMASVYNWRIGTTRGLSCRECARTAGRRLLPRLLCLPLLFGPATEAAAQTVPTLRVEIPTVTEGAIGTIKLTLSQAASHSIEISVGSSTINDCISVAS